MSSLFFIYLEYKNKCFILGINSPADIPKNSLARWKRLSKKWLIEEKKWRPKKEENLDFSKMNLKEQNEYLRTENLYLKELHKPIYWESP